MKLLLSLLLAIAWPLAESKTTSDCKEFRTGKFKLLTEVGEYLIERNDSIQIETDLLTGETSKYQVSWVNDCQFELRIIEGSKNVMTFYQNKVLLLEITGANPNGYQCTAQLQGNSNKYNIALESVAE